MLEAAPAQQQSQLPATQHQPPPLQSGAAWHMRQQFAANLQRLQLLAMMRRHGQQQQQASRPGDAPTGSPPLARAPGDAAKLGARGALLADEVQLARLQARSRVGGLETLLRDAQAGAARQQLDGEAAARLAQQLGGGGTVGLLESAKVAGQQQQQQQQEAAFGAPAADSVQRQLIVPIAGAAAGSGSTQGVCRYNDTPIAGSSFVRSYGLAMVQGDKLPPLPAGGARPAAYDVAAGPAVGRPAPPAGAAVCLVSSGVDVGALSLAGAALGGCEAENALDPGGCPFAWWRDATGRGTHLASIVAGAVPGPGGAPSQQLGVLPGAEVYSVRAWDRGDPSRSGGAAGDGPFAADRLLPYTACEGRLRGAAAQSFQRANYRMAVLLDLQAAAPGGNVRDAAGRELYPSEADWVASAAAFADDLLFIAPAGDGPAPAYPAALGGDKSTAAAGGDRVLSVGAVDCSGRRWPPPGAEEAAAAAARSVDLLAPGVDIVGATAVAGPQARLTLSAPPAPGAPSSAPARRGAAEAVEVAVAGDAAGRPETAVAVAACPAGASSCPRTGSAVCVLPATKFGAGSEVCALLNGATGGGCGNGIVLVPSSGAELPTAGELRRAIADCASWYVEPAQQVLRRRPPVLLAPGASGPRLWTALANARPSAAATMPAAATPQSPSPPLPSRGWLAVNPAEQSKRTGTAQAAAWVAGGAARLMAHFPMCGASDVAAAMIETAALLGADGRPTGARGRGGLLQLHDADAALARRPCAAKKIPAPPQPPSPLRAIAAGAGAAGVFGANGEANSSTPPPTTVAAATTAAG